MTPIQQTIYTKLYNTLSPSHLEVIDESNEHVGHSGHIPGKPTHFKIIISKSALPALTNLERHRIIYDILADEIKQIHAISIEFV